MADPHRIDAVLQPAILVEADIGGGVAEVAAAFLAMDHLAGDEPGAAQHGGGIRDLSLRQRHADRAGGDRPFVDIDMGLHIDLDAKPGRFADQKARRADPALAEMKVVADRDAADSEPFDQIMVNEILRRGPGPALSKVITTAPASPVPANSRSFPASSVSRNWGVFGLKKLRGCGSKVTASAGRHVPVPSAARHAITARWPRWTPSKLPIATTIPLGIAAAGGGIADHGKVGASFQQFFGLVRSGGTVTWGPGGSQAGRRSVPLAHWRAIFRRRPVNGLFNG